MSGTLPQIEPKLKIVLVGLTGVGKTTVMNTLLGREDENTEASPRSQTTVCDIATGKHGDQELVIIDTPGVLHTKKTEDEVKKDIAGSIAYTALDGGPHVFLLVMPSKPIGKKERAAVEIIQKIFGDGSINYTLVLFARGGEFSLNDMRKNECLGKFIKGEESYHSFENIEENVNGEKKKSQVPDLVKKINIMVAKNREQNRPCYTIDMLKTHNEMLKEVQQIQMKMESESNVTKTDILHKMAEKFLTLLLGEEWVSLLNKMYESVETAIGTSK